MWATTHNWWNRISGGVQQNLWSNSSMPYPNLYPGLPKVKPCDQIYPAGTAVCQPVNEPCDQYWTSDAATADFDKFLDQNCHIDFDVMFYICCPVVPPLP